jgi:hypothetical protein
VTLPVVLSLLSATWPWPGLVFVAILIITALIAALPLLLTALYKPCVVQAQEQA